MQGKNEKTACAVFWTGDMEIEQENRRTGGYAGEERETEREKVKKRRDCFALLAKTEGGLSGRMLFGGGWLANHVVARSEATR